MPDIHEQENGTEHFRGLNQLSLSLSLYRSIILPHFSLIATAAAA